jgi:hypothetical protein
MRCLGRKAVIGGVVVVAAVSIVPTSAMGERDHPNASRTTTVVVPAPKVTVTNVERIRAPTDDDIPGFWEGLIGAAIGAIAVGGGALVTVRSEKGQAKTAAKRLDLLSQRDAIDNLMRAAATAVQHAVPFAKQASDTDVLTLTADLGQVRAAQNAVGDPRLKALTVEFMDEVQRLFPLVTDPEAGKTQAMRAAQKLDELEREAQARREAIEADATEAA